MIQHLDSTPDPPPPQTVTVPEAARRLGLTEAAVRQRLHRGTLQGVKVHGHVYVRLGPYQPSDITGDVTSPDSTDTTPVDDTADITPVTRRDEPGSYAQATVLRL